MAHADPKSLHRPVAVFDTGLGSYTAVRLLRERLPEVDLVHLADRASFPYGAAGQQELRDLIARTVAFLERFAPSAIVVGSNAPSITVLPELRSTSPLFGVRPPVREALAQAGNGQVGVLGVRSLITSPRTSEHVAAQAGGEDHRVHLIDATVLVELVESGRFATDPGGARAIVERFASAELDSRPGLAALTLSSTHLTWVRDLITRARPAYAVVDPLRGVVEEVAASCPPAGSGAAVGLVTENPHYPFASFQHTLNLLGSTMPLRRVTVPSPTT